MTEKYSDIAVPCPWCGRSAMRADNTADVRVSFPCPFCGKYYRIDFNTMRVGKIRPKSKAYRKK